ncbi:MAG: hypothetical protein ACYSXF_07165 [Planctomycetota bacterium]
MTQRTPAMTTFGVLSIAMGVFYAVMSVIMFLGGPAEGGAAEAAGTSGGMATMIWAGGILASLMLIGSGFGTLKTAPWSRMLTLAFCGLGILVFGAWTITTWFGILPALAVAYTVILGAMCFSPSWKGTGTTTSTSTTTQTPSSDTDESKAAA